MGRQNEAQRRDFFRLRYPGTIRPTLILEDGVPCEVTELSERGLRFLPRKKLASGDVVRGQIRFRDGGFIEVEGTIGRGQNKELVILLEDGITFYRLIQEQLYIVANFPLWGRTESIV